jgi:predicted dehydrogenase
MKSNGSAGRVGNVEIVSGKSIMSLIQPSRRGFLKMSGLAAAAGIFAPNILRADDSVTRQLNFGGIGVGGKGGSDISNTAAEARIVALCDVDRDRLKKAKEKYPDAKTFESFREMFETMGDKLDGVTISTPDHTHYPAAMEALKRKKHCCVQKPLVNRIWEANQLQYAAKKIGVKTNMGNQGHTGESIRVLREWIAAGIIGHVKEIHVWTNRPVWPQGADGMAKFIPGGKEPDTLNWKEWLAQCPDVPYISGLHPFAWRGHREYGAGAMGDMGCHLLDGPFWTCELGEPYKLEATCEGLTDAVWPKASTVDCYFKTKLFGKVKLTWYEGGRKPERPKELDSSVDWSKIIGGFIIKGSDGIILNPGDYCNKPQLLPQAKHEAWVKSHEVEKKWERSLAPGDPQKELVRCIQKEKICGANFDYAVPLTKLCLLGNAAIANPNRSLEWDSDTQSFKDDAKANSMLKRVAVREGWDYVAEKL